MQAGENLDEGGFSGAVVTQNTGDFACADVQIDVVEGLESTVFLDTSRS